MALDRYLDNHGLFVRNDLDTGATYHLPIKDIVVDNVHHSDGGGLQAHNYWDNMEEVIPHLAALVRGAVGSVP